MPFDWSTYIELADWLTQNQSTNHLPVASEAALRSAVSRAYYAAFQNALALLVARKEYQPTGTGTDHGEVIRIYRNHNAQPRRQIAAWLERLRERRRVADYDRDAHVNARMAETSVANAKDVLRHLAAQ